MKCGSCKGSHGSVQEVKACYGLAPAPAPSQSRTAQGCYCSDLQGVLCGVCRAGNDAARQQASAPTPEPQSGGRVPPGRYAVLDPSEGGSTLRFLEVTWGKPGSRWDGYTFMKEQASDTLYPVRNRERRERLFGIILQDVETAMLTYGQELGKCGMCGRTLTNEESRKYGIGPECRSKTPF